MPQLEERLKKREEFLILTKGTPQEESKETPKNGDAPKKAHRPSPEPRLHPIG